MCRSGSRALRTTTGRLVGGQEDGGHQDTVQEASHGIVNDVRHLKSRFIS